MNVLLLTPPLTQLNTPYPATAYLKAWLDKTGHQASQCDLGIELISKLFTSTGLKDIFSQSIDFSEKYSANALTILSNKERYINTIDAVMHFLRGNDNSLVMRICNTDFLPEASRFGSMADLDWAFGTTGAVDRARYLATLYLEDLTDFISETVNPHFGLNRYAEKLSLYLPEFKPLAEAVSQKENLVDHLLISILKDKLADKKPRLVGFNIPFPGNLYGAIKCCQYIRKHHPEMSIVWGGGYVSTELRSLSDPAVFSFTDFVVLDDGESAINPIIDYLNNDEQGSLHKTFIRTRNKEVKYYDTNPALEIPFNQRATPDFTGLPFDKYISLAELTNPMHKLWSDGRWIKMTLAHGCYWAKCAFCDTTLPYIGKYQTTSPETIVDTMEALIKQTSQAGFHFVDEAAPPKILREISEEIIRRKLVVSWWTNIRFEKAFTPELCKLMAKAGCIAVSGGMEVATDRLLKLMSKGVTVEQAVNSTRNLTNCGIMVHTYLMYGFPSQTEQETIDALEIIRQMFTEGYIQSAFWHRYAMTTHSPSGLKPETFGAKPCEHKIGSFANNEIPFTDKQHIDLDRLGEGLRKATFNYMHGLCLDWAVDKWFTGKIAKTKIPANYVEKIK